MLVDVEFVIVPFATSIAGRERLVSDRLVIVALVRVACDEDKLLIVDEAFSMIPIVEVGVIAFVPLNVQLLLIQFPPTAKHPPPIRLSPLPFIVEVAEETIFNPPVPAVKLIAVAPVEFPIAIVWAAAFVPKLIAPVPVFKVNAPFVVVNTEPPVPVFILTAVAPVTLPTVTVCAIAFVPIFSAPVPEFKVSEVAPVELPKVIACATAFVPILIAPVPELKTNDVAPVELPKAIVLALAPVPILRAPVD